MKKNRAPVTTVEEYKYLPVRQKFICNGQIHDKYNLDIELFDFSDSFLTKEKNETIIISKNKVICLLTHNVGGKNKTFKGVSICSRKDSFDETKGKKIAFLRAKIAAYEAELNELTK